MDNGQFITAFQTNYDRVYNYIGGGDNHLILSLASKYTITNKVFSGLALEKINEAIDKAKNRNFPFQPGTPASYKLASYLQESADLYLAIETLVEKDHALSKMRFKANHYRILASFFLSEDRQQHAKRTKHLFDEMKRNHPFLTTNKDIPYIVLLTFDEDNPVIQAKTMSKYYRELRNHRFEMGNHLQALTQIMTIYSVQYNETLWQYIVKLRDELESHGLKVKKIHYPFIGILALAATNDTKIDEIVKLHNELLTLKPFKSSKEYALIVSIKKIIKELIHIQAVVDLAQISQLNILYDIADYAVDITYFFPSGLSSLFNGDFFN